MKSYKYILFRVDASFQIIIKDNAPLSLGQLQELVGGFIEIHPLNERQVVICDEEGRLKNKLTNPIVDGFVGDIILTDVSNLERGDENEH